MADLNDMMVFALVVDKGGFTAAAHSMDLPKSNISRKVTRLEESLGVRLLERTTRQQRLTEVGQQYYDHCVRIKEEMDCAEQLVLNSVEVPQGKLNICCSVGIGQDWLGPQMSQFMGQYPDVQISMALNNRRVDLIDEGFDLVIRVGELADSNLVARKLSESRLGLYASPTYLQQQPSINGPADLTNHACLFMNEVHKKPRWQLKKKGEEYKLIFKAKFESNDFSLLRRMACEHVGIVVLPDYMAKSLVDNQSLTPVLPEWELGKVPIYALFPSHRGSTPKLKAFVNYLASQCEKQDES